MLEKIDTMEIMTTRAAKLKYRTHHIVMVLTEIVDEADNDLGYVIYAAEDNRELIKVRDEYKGMRVAFLQGTASEPYPSIGNVVYYD